MNFIAKCVFALVLLLTVSPAISRGQDIFITEFMAVGSVQVLDDDGDDNDFIEIFNDGVTTEDLGGYFLSDDCGARFKWTFPAGVTIEPGRFLVVWASEKNRTDPCCPLHTNFRLSGDGECVLLTDPFGDVIHDYAFYPNQQLGYSYGLEMNGSGAERVSLVEPGAPCTATVPPFTNPPNTDLSWTQPGFNDSSWATGTTGVGYDTGPDYHPMIGLDLGPTSMQNNTTCTIRIPFQIADPAGTTFFDFSMKYDDGYVAYINGTRVTSREAPAQATSTSASTSDSLDAKAFDFEPATFDEGTPTLVMGENILAIQALNRSTDSSDLLALPTLEGFSVGNTGVLVSSSVQYFPEPTPGFGNVPGAPDISQKPEFSEPSGAYPPGLSIALSMIVPVEGTVIRYTLDQSVPNESSPLYDEPIDVQGEVVIAARAFQPGLLPSKPIFNYYVILGVDVLNFDSSIPLLVCSTLGESLPPVCSAGPYTEGRLLLFKRGGDGRARLANAVDLEHYVGYRRRGNPSVGCLREKMYFNIEFRDRENKDDDELLFDGWAIHSDYAMFPPWNIDRAFMRNPIAYWMSRAIGQWAPQTEFVECFLHTSGQQELTMASYHGVYVLSERVERGVGRVDIKRLDPGDNEEPDVTGGYILQRDRTKTDDTSVTAGGFPNMVFSYPRDPSGAQLNYFRDYIDTSFASLHPGMGSNADSTLVDVESFIDYHILNLYPKEVDAFLFSSYMYKPRNGLLFMGPIWDYDRTMGAADDARVADPLGWDAVGTRMFERSYSWYGNLFDNQPPLGSSAWARAYRARWRDIRSGPLRTANIHGQIDAWAALLLEPAVRNQQRWPSVPPRFGSYQGEINHLKNWLETRANWIDVQFQDVDGEFVDVPTFSHPGGNVDPDFEVEISAVAGDIYYTLNGPDPRNGSETNPAAIFYDGPITITDSTRIRARARVGIDWSGLVEARYLSGDTAVGVFDEALLIESPATCGDATCGPACGPNNDTFYNGDNSYTSIAQTDRDLWTTGDTFEFAYNRLEGDFDVSVRMDDFLHPNPGTCWGKYGIMARQTLDHNARMVSIQNHGPCTAAHQSTSLMGRTNHLASDELFEEINVNGAIVVASAATVLKSYEYLRLTRRGNTMNGWASDDPEVEDDPTNDSLWIKHGRNFNTTSDSSSWLVGFCNSEHNGGGCDVQEADFTLIRWPGVSDPVDPVDPITGLVVTEIMYQPQSLPGDAFGVSLYEFIEFQNTGDEPLDLAGVTLEQPFFDFTNSAISMLGVGEYLVVVRSMGAFVERHGDAIPVAGQFSGALGNSIQNILLEGPIGEVLMDFDYQSSWQPSANGQGHSLVIRDPAASPSTWSISSSWRASFEVGGSPGREDELLGRRVQGDVNGNGFLDIADVMGLLFTVTGQLVVAPCSTGSGNFVLHDIDGDGDLTVNDAIRVLRFLFLSGPPPDRGSECTPIPGCPDACF
jgi:hypothetical protein